MLARLMCVIEIGTSLQLCVLVVSKNVVSHARYLRRVRAVDSIDNVPSESIDTLQISYAA
jgi:hypothetical protein